MDTNTNIGAFEQLTRFPVYNEYFVVSGGDLLPQQASASRLRPQITTSALNIGFETTNFTRGSEGAIARRLVTFEKQTGALGGEVEYISSSITGAPTSSRRRLSGLVATPESSGTPSSTSTGTTEVSTRPQTARPTATTRTRGSSY